MTWLELIAIWGIAWKVLVVGATFGIGRWWYRTKRANPYI